MRGPEVGTPEWFAALEFQRKKRTEDDEAKARKATLLIAPHGEREPKCRAAVLDAIEQIGEDEGFLHNSYINNSEMREKLNRFANAVEKLKAPWNDLIASGALLVMPPVASAEALFEFAARCREVAGREEARMPDKDAAMKLVAVRLAYDLLKEFGVEPRIPAHDRKSKWCRLATLLHGTGDDLTSQCKLYKKALKAEAKKGANQV